jgi:hypothetical protein
MQDYGNAESNNLDTGAGSMEAIYFGNSHGWGHGGGAGPWVMADLENGLWAGNVKAYTPNPSMTAEFVTAMVKGGTNGFGLRGGGAISYAMLMDTHTTVTPTGRPPHLSAAAACC